MNGIIKVSIFSLQKILSLLTIQPTLSSDDVSPVFREPFLLSGYRVPHQPWRHYVISLFQLHNETFNIWTHLAAFFIFIYKIYRCAQEVPVGLWSDGLGGALVGFFIGILTYSLLSAVAHLFQSKSELAHIIFFQLDYIGIGVNLSGCCILSYYFFGSRSFYQTFGAFFIPFNFILGMAVCITCGLAKLIHIRPQSKLQVILKLGVCGLHILYGFSPIVYRFAECVLSTPPPSNCEDFVENCYEGFHEVHLVYVVSFFVSVCFYMGHVPERLSPGSFDLVGHGHGLFHISMAATSLFQLDAALYELRHRSPELVRLADPTWNVIVGGILCVTLVDAVFIVATHRTRVSTVQAIYVRPEPESLSKCLADASNEFKKAQDSSRNDNGFVGELRKRSHQYMDNIN